MYTHRRLRCTTRWNRRLCFALLTLLLLLLSWRAYRAYEQARQPVLSPVTQLV
jgi:hypothetical protein